MRNKIVWLLLGCLAIRLIGLNQSLWLDEAISANVVKNYSHIGIVRDFSKSDFHPPLYYLVLKSWVAVFGNGEISLRMPSIIFSLATIYFVYLIGGLGPAALTGFNPLFVYYSQEARMYSMVTMLLTMALYYLVKKKYWRVSILFGLSFLTFYGSVFLMVALGIYLLIKRDLKSLAVVAVGPLAALALLSPLMTQQIKTSQEMLTLVPNWDLVLGKASWKNLLMIPMKFSSGRISFYPKYLYYLVSGLWALFVFIEMFERQMMNDLGQKKYFFLFWMTIIAGLLFSTGTPMLQYFRFLYLIPILALAINKNKVMVVGFVVFSLIYVLNPSFYREDWKSLSSDLRGKVYMVDSFSDPINYYTQTETADIRDKINGDKITVVPYGEIIHGVDHTKILTAAGYSKTGIRNYRELTSEEWTKMK